VETKVDVETKVYESEHIDRDVTPVFSKIIVVSDLENSIEKKRKALVPMV